MSILYDMRSGELVKSKLFNNGLLLKDASKFSPLTLFAGGKQGVWYDLSDKSTLFQDIAGTLPVTKDGDPVALIRDKSGNGNHVTQSVSASRPVYKTDGILHWLQVDGVDDYFIINYPFSKYELWLGIEMTNTSAGYLFDAREDSSDFYYGEVGLEDYKTTNVGYLTPTAFADSAKVVGLNLDFTSSKMTFMAHNNLKFKGSGKLFNYIQVAGSLTSDTRLMISDYLAQKTGVINTPAATPSISSVSDYLLNGGGESAIAYAMVDLADGATDWVLDLANNSVTYIGAASGDGGTSAPDGKGWIVSGLEDTYGYFATDKAAAATLCLNHGPSGRTEVDRISSGKVYCISDSLAAQYTGVVRIVNKPVDAPLQGGNDEKSIPIDIVAAKVISNAESGHAPSQEAVNNSVNI